MKGAAVWHTSLAADRRDVATCTARLSHEEAPGYAWVSPLW
jgi:hypothetical protein